MKDVARDRSTADLVGLLRRAADGEHAAFQPLYAATSAKLFGIVLRILRRRDLAEEVLQEAYVRIWNHAATFDATRSSPITWMATIARNRALDEVRRISPLSIEDTPAALQVADGAALASEVVEQSQQLVRLQGCLDALEPPRREMVRLAYLEGRSREELAAAFGHPVGTIKTWLHRSLKQLKDCLST
jgi:RNA polymerase sigma-70 factor (ECF subfamily)